MVKVNMIGAGILGASTAYELAKMGHEVVIADSAFPGRATSAAAGIICPWISKRRNMAWYALAKGGAAYYPELIRSLQLEGETSTGYQKVGALRMHHNLDKLHELKEIAIKRQAESPEMGEIKLLNQDETQTLFPYAPKEFHALYISGAARVDGDALRNAMLRSAERHGAVFVQGEASLVIAHQEVTGMRVGEDIHSADVTIAVNGVWMNELLSPLQPTVHFQAQKGELLHLQIDNRDTATFPVIMPPNNQYILPLEEGQFIAGATHHTVHEFHSHLTAEGTHYILDQLFRMAPGAEKAAVSDSRVGFRPFTKNHLPVFGPLPGYQQLLIGNGLGASGLTTAPFIGKQLAYIAAGEITDVPMADYDVRLAE